MPYEISKSQYEEMKKQMLEQVQYNNQVIVLIKELFSTEKGKAFLKLIEPMFMNVTFPMMQKKSVIEDMYGSVDYYVGFKEGQRNLIKWLHEGLTKEITPEADAIKTFDQQYSIAGE